MCIRHSVCTGIILWFPLMSTGRTFSQFPFITKHILKIIITPLSRRRCPRTFKTTCNRMFTMTATEGIFPTHTLFFNASCGRFSTDKLTWIGSTVCFSEGMTASNQGDCFFIIHGHTTKGFTYISRRSHWIGMTIRSFWIDINKAHLNSS